MKLLLLLLLSTSVLSGAEKVLRLPVNSARQQEVWFIDLSAVRVKAGGALWINLNSYFALADFLPSGLLSSNEYLAKSALQTLYMMSDENTAISMPPMISVG